MAEAFICDRCKKYGPELHKETLKGGQIVKEAFKLTSPNRAAFVSGSSPYICLEYVDKVDLCIICAASLVKLLKNWWAEGLPPDEDMVEFDSIDELVETLGQ
jgi:hypothetical protein